MRSHRVVGLLFGCILWAWGVWMLLSVDMVVFGLVIGTVGIGAVLVALLGPIR